MRERSYSNTQNALRPLDCLSAANIVLRAQRNLQIRARFKQTGIPLQRFAPQCDCLVEMTQGTVQASQIHQRDDSVRILAQSRSIERDRAVRRARALQQVAQPDLHLHILRHAGQQADGFGLLPAVPAAGARIGVSQAQFPRSAIGSGKAGELPRRRRLRTRPRRDTRNTVIGKHSMTRIRRGTSRHVATDAIEASFTHGRFVARETLGAEPSGSLGRRRNLVGVVTGAAPQTVSRRAFAGALRKLLDVAIYL